MKPSTVSAFTEIEKRLSIMENNEPITLTNAGFSRRALGILQKMGYNANTKLSDIDETYRSCSAVENYGPKTAMEISKRLTKYRREQQPKT